MRVSNPDRSPAGIHGWDTAPTPNRFAEIVSDYFRSTLSFTSWMSAFALLGPL
jgi:hypothetical protein